MGTQLPLQKGSEAPSPIFGPFLLWLNRWMHQDATSMEVGLSPGDCVRWGTSPSPKRGRSPSSIFGPCPLWPNGWMDQDGIWHRGGPCSRPLCVRWGPSPSSPKRGRARPQFSAHVYCDQTARCIKIPLRMEVGLSPGDFVLDGNPAPSPKRGRDPIFSAHVYRGQTAAWIKMPLGTEVGIGSGHIVLDGDPPPPQKGGGHSSQ